MYMYIHTYMYVGIYKVTLSYDGESQGLQPTLIMAAHPAQTLFWRLAVGQAVLLCHP